MANIGFIGLGHMGNPMAQNLAKKSIRYMFLTLMKVPFT